MEINFWDTIIEMSARPVPFRPVYGRATRGDHEADFGKPWLGYLLHVGEYGE